MDSYPLFQPKVLPASGHGCPGARNTNCSLKETAMKALILAAGRGTRIRSVHGERPKCLIRLNDVGDTILDQQIENLFSAGVSNI